MCKVRIEHCAIVAQIMEYCVVTVPPDIINEDSSADLAVQEGEDATLTCKATGNPQPRVIWRREDGEMILIRKPGSRELMKGELWATVPQ